MKDINEAQKLRDWKHTLKRLEQETGTELREVAEYIGSAYNEDGVSFYVKMPKKRKTFIGIGMAFHQPLEVINNWIMRFGGKRKLYAKDISEDLVWIYLINANYIDKDSGINYYLRYDDYQAAAFSIFREKWDEIVYCYEDTADIEISLGQAELGPEYDGIKEFVVQHMDAFKTAYSKPRTYLDNYVGKILEVCRRNPDKTPIRSLNSMRGYLDDSMINFLSGSSETINVIDKKTGKRTINIKHVPKGRKKYINLCLSLGMTTQDINEFLGLMGYSKLDMMDRDEGRLVKQLIDWEYEHPLQRSFKSKYFGGDNTIQLSEDEDFSAVAQMLQLKSETAEVYR